jgi:hypothetical protein
MRSTLTLCLLLASFAPAQELRRGITDADVVVVGRQVGKTPHDENLVLHRVQVLHDVHGAAGNTALTVLDWPKLALHQRPSPRQSRLYCLQDASALATRLGLPTASGPYYKMVGWAGSSPLIGAEIGNDAVVLFARVLARTDARAVDTAGELCTIAVRGNATVRTEAARFLTERGDLRATLGPAQWSDLIARASGETDDVPYKIALAELCAEQRIEGLVETLAVSLGPVQDPEYARAVGRIARALHGEEATTQLEQRLLGLREPKDRAMVLLAIGATNTEAALGLLLRLDGVLGKDPAVEAALQEHKSPRAKEAALRRK